MTRAGESFDYDQEIGLQASITVGGSCLGSILNHGKRGVEVFDVDDISLGLVPNREAAIDTLFGRWESRSNGGNPSSVHADSKPKPPPEPGPAREDDGQLTHDIAMAKAFLTGLDPTATRFTFQTFDDNKDRKSKALARVLHGTLDECFAKLTHLNNLGAGIFVTINETNFLGRSAKNIMRPRALFSDANKSRTPGQSSRRTTQYRA